jgi:putative tRNA adenosine deaminase-associated protein
VAEDGFAVALHRGDGRWTCARLPPGVLDDLDRCVAALRAGAALVLVDVADEFFVALRPGPAGAPRVLLSDVTAAREWPLARQALDLAGGDPTGPGDPEQVWPAGDLGIFRDLGLDERELALILGDVDRWAGELLAAVADRIGAGPEFARALPAIG